MTYDHQIHAKLDELKRQIEGLEKKINAIAEATGATGPLGDYKKPYHW